MANFQLASAFVEIGVPLGKLKAGLAQAKGVIGGFASGIGATLAPIGAAIAAAFALKTAINNAMEGEAAEASLAAALRATGNEVDNNLEKFKELAVQIQANTTVGDETTLGLATMGLNMGLTADSTDEAIRAAIGLSRAYEIELPDAMREVSKEMLGVESRLNRSIPALRGVEGQTKRLAMVSQLAAQGMEQEIEFAKTGKGSWQQFQNALGDTTEALGAVLGPALTSATQSLTYFLDHVQAGLGFIQDFGIIAPESFTKVGGSIDGIGASLSGLWDWIKEVGGAFMFAILNWDLAAESLGLTLAKTFTHAWETIKAVLQNIGNMFLYMFKNIVQWGTVIGDYLGTVFVNIKDNVISLFSEIWDYIKSGGTDAIDWSPMFKDLTEGVVESFKLQSPEIAKAVYSDFSGQEAELAKKYDKRMEEWNKVAERHKPVLTQANNEKTKKELKEGTGLTAVSAGSKKDKERGGQLFSGASLWEAVAKGSVNKEAKAALREAQIHSKLLKMQNEKTDTLIEKMGTSQMVMS